MPLNNGRAVPLGRVISSPLPGLPGSDRSGRDIEGRVVFGPAPEPISPPSRLQAPVHVAAELLSAEGYSPLASGLGWSRRDIAALGQRSAEPSAVVARDGIWTSGGHGDLYPDLQWSTRPDMTGSEASEDLQRAWVAAIMAIRQTLGAARSGSCYYINLAAAPLVQAILGEPVEPCAGYAGFVGNRGCGKFECGFRWRPDKWRDWIDAGEAAHLSLLQDLHVWIETRTHVIDFTTGDAMGNPFDNWPPLIYWPKWKLPKHPREARGRQTVLLWRDAAALATVALALAPTIEPIARRAFEIYAEMASGQLADTVPPSAGFARRGC